MCCVCVVCVCTNIYICIYPLITDSVILTCLFWFPEALSVTTSKDLMTIWGQLVAAAGKYFCLENLSFHVKPLDLLAGLG